MPDIILNDKKARKIILNGRTYFGKPITNEPDILNHGNVQGWNFNYFGYQIINGGSYYFTLQNNIIVKSWRGDNTTFIVADPIRSSQYSKFFIDVEIPQGTNGQWNHIEIGAIYTDHFLRTPDAHLNFSPSPTQSYCDVLGVDANQTVTSLTLLSYAASQFNILGNDPWYLLPRHTFEIDVPNPENDYKYNIVIQTGFNACNIHSIWLES